MKTIKSITLFSSLMMTVLQVITVQADQVRMYDKPLAAEEMGSLLFGSSDQAAYPVKMRSISFKPKQEKPIALAQRVEAERVSVGLPIEFAYNSTEILPESLPFLEEVGKMLTMPQFDSKRLIIEGHTDATGSANYNLSLSKRRARAVSDFLIQNYGVSKARLKTTGMGEQSPLADKDPFDEVNRRVQFYSSN